MKKIKLNLHLSERCNFACKYCFAKYSSRKDLSLEEWKSLLQKVKSSSLCEEINFAGGEPMLFPKIGELIAYSKRELSQTTSLITNGSLLTEKWIFENIQNVDMIGFSVDTFDEKIAQKIGRGSGKAHFLYEEFEKAYHLIRKYHPSCKIKINVVVNTHNWEDTSLRRLSEFSLDRIKILRAQPFQKEENGILVFDNREMLISENEFSHFLQNHSFAKEAVVEEDMERSYFIIDNAGNLLDNSGGRYLPIGNLLEKETSLSELLSAYSVNWALYLERYQKEKAS